MWVREETTFGAVAHCRKAIDGDTFIPHLHSTAANAQSPASDPNSRTRPPERQFGVGTAARTTGAHAHFGPAPAFGIACSGHEHVRPERHPHNRPFSATAPSADSNANRPRGRSR
jgi:hypothetical protein